MRLIDADELLEHAYRDKLDSRELIAKMIKNAPTVKAEQTASEKLDDIIVRAEVNNILDLLTRHTALLNDIKMMLPSEKTAEWLHMFDDYNDWLECSECGYGAEGEVKFGEETNYCPNCGAKMKGEKE